VEAQMSAKPFVLSVKAVIRDKQDRCLVVRRSAGSKNDAGCWDFPGGKVDAGERFDTALLREIQEETGLSVELAKILGAAESNLRDRKVAYLILEARLVQGQVRLSEEHDGFEWMTLENLAKASQQFRGFVREMAEE
jgi:8-oxo-dGTP diphosphatase